MDYLKEYNMTDEDINDIYNSLSEEEWIMISTSSSRVEELLEYFTSLGITYYKDLFIEKPNIFLFDVEDIEKKINECNEEDIVNKLKDNIYNFELLGI